MARGLGGSVWRQPRQARANIATARKITHARPRTEIQDETVRSHPSCRPGERPGPMSAMDSGFRRHDMGLENMAQQKNFFVTPLDHIWLSPSSPRFPRLRILMVV